MAKIVLIHVWQVDRDLEPTGEEFTISATSVRSAMRSLSEVRDWIYTEGAQSAWEQDGQHCWMAMRIQS